MYYYKKVFKLDLILPLLFLFFLFILSRETKIDEWGAAHFVQLGAKGSPPVWFFKDNFLLQKILHKDGVILTIILNAILFLYLGFVSWKKPQDKQKIHYLLFVLCSVFLTIMAVFFLKRWATFPCPWETLSLGGKIKTPSLEEIFSYKLPSGHCFPAGHSSGGFCFLALYFGHSFIYGKRNLWTLLPGLVLGIFYGLAQEMRGAHFFSHDVATIFMSILSSWITSLLFRIF